MLFQLYGSTAMTQLLGWVLVFAGLVILNEIGRRTKIGGIVLFVIIPAILTIYFIAIQAGLFGGHSNQTYEYMNGWFHYAKLYSADIGVVGKDTIVEEGRNVHEVLDLGFGSCRMCVCGPQDAKELLEHREVIRVATKYPKIAKDYFYNKKHQTVEIIKMNGSIELAPIVGLSEVIVDIVETGSTLKENGLTVLEEVCPLSARMIVNPVSMRMENDRIRDLIGRIRNLLEGETV